MSTEVPGDDPNYITPEQFVFRVWSGPTMPKSSRAIWENFGLSMSMVERFDDWIQHAFVFRPDDFHSAAAVGVACI